MMKPGAVRFIIRSSSLVVLWLMLPITAISQGGHDYEIISEPVRRQWITDASTQLCSAAPTSFVNKLEFYESNRGTNRVLAFQVFGSGFYEFSSNNWVGIITHSFHQTPLVGDVVLAIDQSGQFYQSKTHVCGGSVNFLGYSMTMPTNSAEFFAMFESDTRNSSWKKPEFLIDCAAINEQ